MEEVGSSTLLVDPSEPSVVVEAVVVDDVVSSDVVVVLFDGLIF